MSVDFESDFETTETKSLQLVPKLLNLFDDYSVKATFFVVGNLVEQHEDILKEIAKKHELGSHSWSHPRMDILSEQEAEREIVKTKEALKAINITCNGFRAPMFLPHKQQNRLLKKHGFRYSSSLSSFFPGRYCRPFTKTKPFKHNSITELPVPNFISKIMPAGFSYYRYFHPITKVLPLPYMVYMHPCEFLGKMPQTNIHPITKHFYSGKMKKAWELAEELIRKNEDKWVSCQEYLNSKAFSKL